MSGAQYQLYILDASGNNFEQIATATDPSATISGTTATYDLDAVNYRVFVTLSTDSDTDPTDDTVIFVGDQVTAGNAITDQTMVFSAGHAATGGAGTAALTVGTAYGYGTPSVTVEYDVDGDTLTWTVSGLADEPAGFEYRLWRHAYGGSWTKADTLTDDGTVEENPFGAANAPDDIRVTLEPAVGSNTSPADAVMNNW